MQAKERIEKLRANPIVQRIEKFFPAIAFLAGFGWDSVTLGTMVYGSDLLILLAYYVGAFILVILLSAKLDHPEGWTKERLAAVAKAQGVQAAPGPSASREPQTKVEEVAEKLKSAAENKAQQIADKIGYESTAVPVNAIVVHHRFLDREWSPVWKARFTWAVQFLFGGRFSALVVCYFKSSGSLASFLLVIALACMLVGNEFLQKKYESFGVSLAFFCLLGTMFLNYIIPHVVHRIGFFWFLLSTLLSLGLCVWIWKISHRSKAVLVAPVFISSLLIVAYLMNWVPPVPLVLKQQIPCQNFDRKNFSCDVDAPGFLQKLGLQAPSVHKAPDGVVYFLAAVYAPAALKAELEYRWYYKDPSTGEYRLTDKISSGRMVINGGREQGFRSYSKKSKVPAGKYRVETAYKDGAVIGSLAFDVIDELRDSSGYVRDSLR